MRDVEVIDHDLRNIVSNHWIHSGDGADTSAREQITELVDQLLDERNLSRT